MNFFEYTFEQRFLLWEKIVEHLWLTGVATVSAIVIGVPLGILITRYASWRGFVLGVAGVMQTIPSVAMLALLMIPLGLGQPPAIGALILYALLPIIVNTLTGLAGVDPNILEAAYGLGFTSNQKLWIVELPLASPVIIAGIRTSAVITVGIATLSALIGAGGLGDFIFRGLSTMNYNSIMLGVVAASSKALLLGGLIGWLEQKLKRRLRQK